MPRNMPEVAYINEMFELFRDEIESKSNNQIDVKIYYAGTLGKPDERLNLVRRNVIQMSDASDGNYATIHRDIQIFSIPYLFPDLRTAHAILDGEIGSKVAEDIRLKTGIRVLGWWETAGFKHYSSNDPIKNPDDLVGKKMRVMSAVFSQPVIAMGGAATPIPMPELYVSLKTGLVDGQDNAISVFNMLKLYEVQKFITLDSHIYGFGPLGINDEFFTSLSKEHQQLIITAGKKAIAWNRELSKKQEEAAISFAMSKNVTVIPISEAMRSSFISKTRPAAIDWMKTNIATPSLVDELLDAVENQLP